MPFSRRKSDCEASCFRLWNLKFIRAPSIIRPFFFFENWLKIKVMNNTNDSWFFQKILEDFWDYINPYGRGWNVLENKLSTWSPSQELIPRSCFSTKARIDILRQIIYAIFGPFPEMYRSTFLDLFTFERWESEWFCQNRQFSFELKD